MKRLLLIMPVAALLGACSDEIPTVSLGIDGDYYIYRMSKLPLRSELTGAEYRWTLHRGDGRDSVISSSRDCIFLTADEGVYDMSFDIIDQSTPYHHDFKITVLHEEVEYSAYISKVYEYCPAPGQFINEMPLFEAGDSYADMVRKCEESIGGLNDVMISLGGFGGYVTFGFDHTVVNRPGEYDFMIYGNAFYELTDISRRGGSCEPGIVSVSYDANCNGLPDDPWYELAGSEYYKPSTLKNLSITYRRPDPDRKPVADGTGFLCDLEYIPWSTSAGESGFMPKNTFHPQEYYPLWLDADELTLTGTCLPRNAVDLSGTGRYYVLYSYEWGYVDNHPNEYQDLNSFKIDWAVDADGNHVELPGVDFIRVMTGINQYCGWLGETSTELSKARDLHIDITPYLPDDPFTNQ
ncbi:MAG: cell surface protein [Muribaculaceae bacterium]|nr:cell surface protein [Muribaculaceae bacterium]